MSTTPPPPPPPPQFPNPPPSPPESPSGAVLHDDIFSDSPPSSPRLSGSTPSTTTTTTSSTSTSNRSHSLPPDLFKLKSTHNTQGYLAGLTSTKPVYIQAGFDEGYKFGGKLGMVVGWVRGVGEGLLAVRPGERRMREAVGEMERELSVERVFAGEFVDGEGRARWAVGTWEGAEKGEKVGGEGEEEEDVDLLVQSHPLVRKWVERMVGLAREVGLDVVGGGGSGGESGDGEAAQGSGVKSV
ncbi:hypothetical protein DFH27DRAFT_622993 [Peziza echinospora]|nr:hypothetical protein DFH27DRAFT_622993 [Peziza echinospora]